MRPILRMTVAPRFVALRIVRQVAEESWNERIYINLMCPAPRETKNTVWIKKKRGRKTSGETKKHGKGKSREEKKTGRAIKKTMKEKSGADRVTG